MIGYVFALIALLCASGLGVFFKVADLKGCKPSVVSTMLFVSSSVVLWIYTLSTSGGHGVFPASNLKGLLIAAIACGACAGLGILTFQIGVRYGRIATSWLIVNLSTLVPAVMSFVIYREWQKEMRWQQLAAMVLILVSVFLLWRDKEIELRKSSDASKK